MGRKISPVILIVIIVVIAALAFLVVSLFAPDGIMGSNANNGKSGNSAPVLELSLNTEEEDQEKVIIKAVAVTEDEAGIEAITLPGGTDVPGDIAEFEVTKNGVYTFRVKGANGQSATLNIEVTNILVGSASRPYLPTGFKHTVGEPETGYTIEDSFGNQYIWVPVENGQLTRKTMLDGDYDERGTTATELVNSVAKYYGFYIGKYEASEYDYNGKKVAASRAGKMPWVNITYEEAASYSEKSATDFGYDNYRTSIINSYAWDTVIGWIDKIEENYSSRTSFGNYSGQILPTGATSADIFYNICDLAGNVREWTTEIYTGAGTESTNKTASNRTQQAEKEIYRVVRGGSANLSRTPISHTGNPETTSDPYWGFRLILYK